jgi:hypothetical protein
MGKEIGTIYNKQELRSMIEVYVWVFVCMVVCVFVCLCVRVFLCVYLRVHVYARNLPANFSSHAHPHH